LTHAQKVPEELRGRLPEPREEQDRELTEKEKETKEDTLDKELEQPTKRNKPLKPKNKNS